MRKRQKQKHNERFGVFGVLAFQSWTTSKGRAGTTARVAPQDGTLPKSFQSSRSGPT